MKPSDDELETFHAIHELFAARAAAAPDDAAVSYGGHSLTCAEVDSRAQAIARRLRLLQAAPGAPVAVLVQRGLELPGALLGTLAAGRAFLPLDPGHPPGRLAQLLGRARPGVVIAQRSLARRLPPQPAPVLWLEDADAPRPGAPSISPP
ncbi:MAG TPA: AMP-binding protein, partial [Thermoanaerobaculia bacterium]|nr:AMP-binding protein [Thermoanaerobaculia bacterium]